MPNIFTTESKQRKITKNSFDTNILAQLILLYIDRKTSKVKKYFIFMVSATVEASNLQIGQDLSRQQSSRQNAKPKPEFVVTLQPIAPSHCKQPS